MTTKHAKKMKTLRDTVAEAEAMLDAMDFNQRPAIERRISAQQKRLKEMGSDIRKSITEVPKLKKELKPIDKANRAMAAAILTL